MCNRREFRKGFLSINNVYNLVLKCITKGINRAILDIHFAYHYYSSQPLVLDIRSKYGYFLCKVHSLMEKKMFACHARDPVLNSH